MTATTQVPIRVFDEANALIAILTSYESAYFERDWQSAGQFEIVINANIENAMELKKGRKVLFGTDYKRIGKIAQVVQTIDEKGKGGEKLTVTGYEAKGMLGYKLVAPLYGQDYFTYNAPAETIMHNLVKYSGIELPTLGDQI